MSLLVVNQLIQWDTEDIERILWLDGQQIVVIDVLDALALPRIRLSEEMAHALTTGKAHILQDDAQGRTFTAENQLTDGAKRKRDQAWELIRHIVTNPQIYHSETRGRIVADRVRQTGCAHKTIYRYLRRYWQGGQVPNALLPQYDSCGARGQPRLNATKKRGRPSHLALERGQPTGVNVDQPMLELFRKGIRRFYENGTARSLRDAYQRTLEHYFNQGYEIQDGIQVPVLPSTNHLPTFWQFEYWYRKERDLTQMLVKREGQNRYNREHRPLLGESTGMSFGPGSVYQIDATVGDIYLVSELDPQRIIGRPVIYLVVDVFSRMVAGLGVTLEGPSWLGAMLALENAATDKTSFCKQYGVTLGGGEWPCHHLPEMLVADRGELEGYNGDQVVHALNIVVANTAPYRADMKGIVEQCFRLTNLRVLNTLPGAVRERERGVPDYRLDAKLTLSQLTTLLIHGAVYHNRHHYMPDYPLDRAMLQAGVAPCPLDLWQWGIENRTGHLRTLPAETIRLSLLPQDEASVTRQGIRFHKLFYTCPTAVEAGWYVQAGQSGRWKVRVSYDPRLVDWLYLWHDGGRRVEACTLVDNSRMHVFRGLDWATVQTHANYQQGQQQAAQTRQQQGRAILNAHKDDVVRQAEAAQPQEKSNHRQVRDITANRRDERTRQRQEDAWRLANAVEPATEEADEGYVPPAQYLDLLRGEEVDHDHD
jgi:hypothetical protein